MITDIVVLDFKGKTYKVQLRGLLAPNPCVYVEVGGGHRCATHWRILPAGSRLALAITEGAKEVLRDPGGFEGEAWVLKRDGQNLPIEQQRL